MSLTVRLLGRPSLTRDGEPAYRFRSQKSWALLAYLVLADQAPTRSRLAELLFDETMDPLGALRWNLAELRRGLGSDAVLEGDPVVLDLAPGTAVDVLVATTGRWPEAVALAGLGEELLAGVTVRGASGFESWLLTARQRLAASSEAVLHEAAQAHMARGELADAVRCAERAAAMNPLDENSCALLVRLLRLVGDESAAASRYAAYARLVADELGIEPGPALEAALREQPHRAATVTGSASVEAILESGAAAVAAGAVAAGLTSLRSAVGLADLASDRLLQVRSRVALGETLVHSLRGMDEDGLSALYEADELAAADGLRGLQAEIRAEIGYVDFLRARYDRAERWLHDALDLADGGDHVTAKASAYLGSVRSDRGDYAAALVALDRSITHARIGGDSRREAFAAAMVGRLHLLRGDLDAAATALHGSVEAAERERWLAFLPWPQAFLGEVELARGRVDEADEILAQAFARACQLGDPCWEGASARGLALVAEARGDVDVAFELLADARVRCNRLADPYVWLDAYILDAQCTLGRRHAHPSALAWAQAMHRLSSRTDMREISVRALLHSAALGADGAADGAELLASGIDNPVLHDLVAEGAAALAAGGSTAG